MKMILLTSEGEITPMEFPEGDYEYVHNVLCDAIGCDTLEIVHPRNLYTDLGFVYNPLKFPGKSMAMIVDEEGLLKKESRINKVASALYGFTGQKGGTASPIVGNVLFVSEKYDFNGIDLCGIEKETFEKLFSILIQLEMNVIR